MALSSSCRQGGKLRLPWRQVATAKIKNVSLRFFMCVAAVVVRGALATLKSVFCRRCSSHWLGRTTNAGFHQNYSVVRGGFILIVFSPQRARFWLINYAFIGTPVLILLVSIYNVVLGIRELQINVGFSFATSHLFLGSRYCWYPSRHVEFHLMCPS